MSTRQKAVSQEAKGDDSLAEVASRYGLRPETVERLRNACNEFRATPAELRKSRSVRKQVNDLEKVAEHALAIREILERLHAGEAMRFDLALIGLDVPEADNCERILSRFVHVQRIACATRIAADRARERIGDTGSNGGRSKSQHFPRSLVAVIAYELMPYNIAPSRSAGRFMRICAACFRRAGIFVDPTDSVREFLETGRAGARERGYSL